MRPTSTLSRLAWLDSHHPQPDIETMTTHQLEDEISVCSHFELYHRDMDEAIGIINTLAHRHQAHLWWQRRFRVTELLRTQVGVA